MCGEIVEVFECVDGVGVFWIVDMGYGVFCVDSGGDFEFFVIVFDWNIVGYGKKFGVFDGDVGFFDCL